MTFRINVRHSTGSYPVWIEAGGRVRLAPFVERVAPGRRPLIITDRNVARAVRLRVDWPRLVVPAGEGSKTQRRWAAVLDRLFEGGYGRDTVIVAVGGGMVGDLAGFVAATFMRGVPCVQVPTSLLAMVDASVGGKTGLNTRHGKNLVGAFHPPVGVLIDPEVTRSQRAAEFRNGLVEAMKHGLVADPTYYRWIARSGPRLLQRDAVALARLIRRSVGIKALIVAGDEREAGRRAVLNAGHTVGHALERAASYRLPHGEAVALGLLVESSLAVDRRRLGREHLAAMAADFRALGLPLRFPTGATDGALLRGMRSDKKTRRGVIHCALLRGLGGLAAGRGPWAVPCSVSSVRRALRATRQMVAE